MNKVKLAIFGGAAVAIAAVSVLAVQAANAPLAVTCGGAVSNNQITWTASPSGGNAPYALLWSGDSSVAGATTTSVTGTYTSNGIYTEMIQATDASSTIATSTCSATVSSNVVATPTSTLNVYVGVNNTAGGSDAPSNFEVTVSGAGATPGSFAGSNTGTTVVLNATSTFSIGVSSIANYTMSESGTCSGSLTAGSVATCTLTETYVTPVVTTPTSTVSGPHVSPSLSIGSNGGFTGDGMTVTSVGSGSFQASVWGITYTIDWSNQLPAVGDVVSVSGKVASSTPMTVTASSVHDYTTTTTTPPHAGQGHGSGKSYYPDYSKKGDGNGNGNGFGARLSSFFSFFKWHSSK